jgi:5-methylcytosine-specific restriction endonuclease McrA
MSLDARFRRSALTGSQARLMAEAVLGSKLIPARTKPYPNKESADRSHRNLVIALLRERDGDNCYLCQQPLELGYIVIEHIIPLALGGTNEPSNVALACPECNSVKGNAFVSMDNDRQPRYHRRQQHPRPGK